MRHCPDAYRPKLVGAVKDFYAQLQKKTYQQRCDYFLAKGIGSAEQDQMWSLKSDLLNFEFNEGTCSATRSTRTPTHPRGQRGHLLNYEIRVKLLIFIAAHASVHIWAES